MEFYVKIYLFPHFLFLFWFSKHDFITCIDFTRIAASNSASDDAHIQYLIQTYYIIVLIL